MHAPYPGAIAAPARRCGSWGARGRRLGRCCGHALDARPALAGVLQGGHQGERAGVVHFRGGCAPGTAAGWPPPAGALRSPVLAPSQCWHGDVDPGEHANVDQVDGAAAGGDVAAGQVLDARAALAGAIAVGVLQDGQQASASAPRTTWPGAHQVMAASWCAVRSGPGQGPCVCLHWRRRGTRTAMWILESVRTSSRLMLRSQVTLWGG